MPINNVVHALKKLSRIDGPQGDISPSSDEAEHLEYFCAEDTLLINDLSVTVVGVGKLSFPLTSDSIENIVKVSSKAKFGKGEATLLDMTVRDTQMIPANMLKVGINDESLCNILERIGSGLNIDKNSHLVPHLHNMLIYGPGQFFKMHRDSEKIKNMVATLVILLPSLHKGGDLIIRHKNSKHIFFGSQKRNVVKCIAFYSDCQHEIEKVNEGYRVALTYNVGLQSPGVISNFPLDEDLNRAVQSYFSSKASHDAPKRLVFYLNHSYSEHSLKWNLLKGTDRTHVFSLLAVAKVQGRAPCLALADYREECELYNDESVLECNTELVFWVDEFNLKFNESTGISENELCFTTETTDLFEPYQEEEEESMGNDGGFKNKWYRRACVILWANKWDFQHGFKNTLHDLKHLTTEKGNEKRILDEINQAGNKFFNMNFWSDPIIVNILMDIAAYVKNKETAVAILTKLSSKVVNPHRIDYLLFLEKTYDKEVLVNTITFWIKNEKDSVVVEKSLKVFEKYLEHANKKHNSLFVEILLKRTVKEFLRQNEKYFDLNIFMGTQLNTMYKIFQVCANLEHVCLWNKVINYMLLHPSVYPLYLANVVLKIQNMTPQNEIHRHSNFKVSTLGLFEKLIAQLSKDETNWSWPFSFPCKCRDCNKLLSFMHSSDKAIDILFSNENKRHIKSVLKYLKEQPLKITKGSTKVFIEKEPKLLETRKKLLGDLVAVEKRLNSWSSTLQKTVDSTFTISNNKDISSSGPLDSQHCSSESVNKRKKI